MIEEWRPVTEFAVRYLITESGKVLDTYSGKRLNVNPHTNSVHLYKGDRRYNRSVDKLVRKAFSERSFPVLGVEGYRPIPNIPGYSINRSGSLYNERYRRTTDYRENDSVKLTVVIDGRREQVHRTIRSLVRDTFPDVH